MKLDDIEWAVEFASLGYGDHEAFIDTETGRIYYIGDAVDEEAPEDIYETEKYLQVPDKRDLGLGKNLAIKFAAEKIPDRLDDVYEIFGRKGAYARFKELLSSLEQLEAWYSYEEIALKEAIIDWCRAHRIKFHSGT